MVHIRTKPATAQRQYGVLVGHVKDGFESPQGSSPHYEVWVDGGADFRIAVNVRSVDGSDVFAYFDPAFSSAGGPDLQGLIGNGPGFTRLATGPRSQGGKGLDYLRDRFFPLASMNQIPPDGSGVSLKNLLDANIERAKEDDTAMIVAFGEYFQDNGPDQYFGFRPEQGLHDIHMMQGNSGAFASDNRVDGDGALFLSFRDGSEIVALFVRFVTQTLHTDDQTGAPL